MEYYTVITLVIILLLILGWRESNPAALKRAKFPAVYASSLKIRQYIGVPQLRRNKNFVPVQFQESLCRRLFSVGEATFCR